jgi:hypothetical protein
VAAAVAAEPAPLDAATQALADAKAAAKAEAAAQRRAATAAHTVFVEGGRNIGTTAIGGTRAPTDAEKSAARGLARALSTAAVRDRTVTRTTSALPPGRLRMRGALVRDAQRAAGVIPTAEPFTRTTRRTVPTPPLRLGIACDVSGSMRAYAAPVASAAWILARAASLTPVPARTATVIYGSTVRPITYPGTAPTLVTEFDANDGWEDVHTAIDALDHTLGLSTPGAARLLVIVSDGEYREEPARHGQQRVNRLRKTGCGVLWLIPHATATPFHGATVQHLHAPADTAAAIGRAATAALRAAQ